MVTGEGKDHGLEAPLFKKARKEEDGLFYFLRSPGTCLKNKSISEKQNSI